MPDAGRCRRAGGGLTPDGRPAEGGISGSSVRMGDRVFKGLAAGSGGLLLVIMAAIAIFLIWKAIPAFTDDSGNIFTTQTWNPQAQSAVVRHGGGVLRHGDVVGHRAW